MLSYSLDTDYIHKRYCQLSLSSILFETLLRFIGSESNFTQNAEDLFIYIRAALWIQNKHPQVVDCFVLFALEELLTCEAHGRFLEPSWIIHIQTTRLSHISNLSKPDQLAVDFAFFSFIIFQGIKSSERHVSCVYVNPEAF